MNAFCCEVHICMAMASTVFIVTVVCLDIYTISIYSHQSDPPECAEGFLATESLIAFVEAQLDCEL